MSVDINSPIVGETNSPIEFAIDQFTHAKFKNLARKVRIQVRRTDSVLELQHVGKKLHVSMYADLDYPTATNSGTLVNISEEALRSASFLLDKDRSDNPTYYRVSDWRICEIRLPDTATGEEVLAALNTAVDALVDKANELIRTLAGGLRFKSPNYLPLS